MRVAIGADHAGFLLKEHVKALLQRLGHSVDDQGTHNEEPVDYPPICMAVGQTVADGRADRGIVLGGSGQGEQIAANKVPGARCALAWSVETATLARQHNNAQLIGIGGRMHTVADALTFVDAFITTPWSEAPRHQRRIDILDEYEKTHVAPPVPGAPE
jgi:ribose 5-phosphate isomerase B